MEIPIIVQQETIVPLQLGSHINVWQAHMQMIKCQRGHQLWQIAEFALSIITVQSVQITVTNILVNQELIVLVDLPGQYCVQQVNGVNL